MGTTTSPAPSASQLDIILDGTWIVAPRVDGAKNIVGIEIYSPSCGHSHGVLFSSVLNPSPKPDSSSYYMLDPHSYTLNVDRSSGKTAGMNASGIPTAVNHCVSIGRPIGSNWDLLVSVNAGPDSWTSTTTIVPDALDSSGKVVHCFVGKDAPAGSISSTQVLSFTGVRNVSLLGAPLNVQSLWSSPWAGGSLLFEDEIAYIPTLQHERMAIFAMANLAGLDLALDYPLPRKSAPASAPATSTPSAGSTTSPPGIAPRLRTGGYCGHSVIVLPQP
ncbi:MAG TPA: hypothetical protein VKR52_14065 [Terracidiphilus sp.]|nr:hypothetical protein [Terracidiphilus sp.]